MTFPARTAAAQGWYKDKFAWHSRLLVMRLPSPLRFTLPLLLAACSCWAEPMQAVKNTGPAAAEPLKLLISVNRPDVTEPLPIRATLHLHNFSHQTLWLYRPVRDAAEAGEELNNPQGGSTLVTQLTPLNLPPGATVNIAAIGTVMKPVDLPHPRLVRLDPGGDLEETLAIRLLPALLRGPAGSSGNLPFWGSYRFSVLYGAGYPNGRDLRREAGMAPWEGAVTSNAVEITLAAPRSADTGTISGTVVNAQGGFVGDALVSLSSEQGHLLNQMVTDSSGQFSFPHLPFATYWVSAWQLGSNQAGGMYEHATLSASQPQASMKLLYEREEASDAKKLRHKPVIFRVTDRSGRPVEDALLDVTWSNGPVMEDLKARTDQNGWVVMEVLPGSNYVSIKKKGCREEDLRSDVSEAIGVGGFDLTFDCERK